MNKLLVIKDGDKLKVIAISEISSEKLAITDKNCKKLYLHLQKMSGADDNEASISEIATKFNMSEEDLLYGALSYLEEHDALAYLSGNFSRGGMEVKIPAKRRYSWDETEQFLNNENFMELVLMAEVYIEDSHEPGVLDAIIYLLTELKFDYAFVQYIMQECLMCDKHVTISSVLKNAVYYFCNGINTIEGAKKNPATKKTTYQKVSECFGMILSQKDVSLIKKWIEQYKFSDEIILEACRRTMEYVSASCHYADKILKNWNDNNIKCMEDIYAIDKKHTEKVTNKRTGRVRKHNFEQRTYDCAKLEKDVIRSQNKKFEEIFKSEKLKEE